MKMFKGCLFLSLILITLYAISGGTHASMVQSRLEAVKAPAVPAQAAPFGRFIADPVLFEEIRGGISAVIGSSPKAMFSEQEQQDVSKVLCSKKWYGPGIMSIDFTTEGCQVLLTKINGVCNVSADEKPFYRGYAMENQIQGILLVKEDRDQTKCDYYKQEVERGYKEDCWSVYGDICERLEPSANAGGFPVSKLNNLSTEKMHNWKSWTRSLSPDSLKREIVPD